MRTREEIEKSIIKPSMSSAATKSEEITQYIFFNQNVLLEVLLDIRELLAIKGE